MTTVGTSEITLRLISASVQEAAFWTPSECDTIHLSVVEEAMTLVVIPRGTKIGNFPTLNAVLLAQLTASRRGVLAVTYLDAEEYGIGKTEQDAVLDLVSSLFEYKDSLEKREHKLAQEALADLAKLRRLFDISE